MVGMGIRKLGGDASVCAYGHIQPDQPDFRDVRVEHCDRRKRHECIFFCDYRNEYEQRNVTERMVTNDGTRRDWEQDIQ